MLDHRVLFYVFITFIAEVLIAASDHVNIIQNISEYDVINNSIVNAFNNSERSIVLDCVTVRGHEYAMWEVPETFDQTQYNVTIHNVYLSTITIVDPGVNISESLKCISDTSKEYRIVTVTTENPYLKLLSNISAEASLGTRPILMYVIAVDDDGTKEEQKNLSSIASFQFVNSDGQIFDYNSKLTEFIETSFQYYIYALPALDEDAEGNYTLMLENSEGTTTSKTVSIIVDSSEDVTVETTYSGITILQGDDITLSCRPSQSDIALQWSYNGSDISSSLHYQFSPPFLNHDLTITLANDADSGNYTCAFILENEVIDEQSITLRVVPTCFESFSGGLLWPTSRRNRVVTQSCSTLHPSFRSWVFVGRKCNDDGTWGPVDDSNCTVLDSAHPTLLISFEVNVFQADAPDVVNNITQQIINSSNVTFVSYDLVLYDLHQTGSTGVLIRLTSNELTENSTLPQLSSVDVPDNILLYNEETKLFIPGLKCRCKSNDDQVRAICIGPSIPPCICSQASCECNIPFIGNSDYCGLDTDGDGCPDEDLGCTEPNCMKIDIVLWDLCVNDYTEFPKCNFDDTICNSRSMEGNTSVCMPVKDNNWNIAWTSATRGQTVLQKCPGGHESLGLASRLCDGDPAFWHNPNVDNCSTVEITRITEEAKEIMATFAAIQDPNNSDRTVTIESDALDSITDDLANATDHNDTVILPNDLENSLDTVEAVLSILGSNPETATNETLTNLVSTVDNLYNPQNEIAYSIVDSREEEATSAGAQALENVVMLVDVISVNLEVNENGSASFSATGESISIEVQLVSETELEEGGDVIFPNNENDSKISVQSVIPNPTLRHYPGPVSNTFVTNSFLPSDFDGCGKCNLSFPVLSVQISYPGRVELPENGDILMNFDIPENLEGLTNPVRCVFWQPERNSWSDEGVSTMRAGDSVECRTTHLTSFAVLVNTQGSTTTSSELALSAVSYVGCSISIVCLLLTMLAIVYWRKSIYEGTHNVIHFNLCLSLVIGLVIFVSAIETAKDHETGCTAVAVLLHYFFLATFSWMLCEGLFLFVFLNFVFYSGFLTKWHFYFGIGWGLPVPIVAIAAGIANDHYGSERGCWLSEEDGTIWAFVAPMLLIILVNCVFLLISLKVVYKNKKARLEMHATDDAIPRIEIAKTVIKSAATLMPILGVTWIFGLLIINEDTVVFAWIFTILNSLQGVSIFFFYVLNQEKVRDKIKVGEYVQRFRETVLSSVSRKMTSSTFNTELMNTKNSSAIQIKKRTVSSGSTASSSVCEHATNISEMLSTGKAVDKPSPMFNNPSFIDARRESETPNNEDTSCFDDTGDETLNKTTLIGNNCDSNVEADLQPKNTQL